VAEGDLSVETGAEMLGMDEEELRETVDLLKAADEREPFNWKHRGESIEE